MIVFLPTLTILCTIDLVSFEVEYAISIFLIPKQDERIVKALIVSFVYKEKKFFSIIISDIKILFFLSILIVERFTSLIIAVEVGKINSVSSLLSLFILKTFLIQLKCFQCLNNLFFILCIRSLFQIQDQILFCFKLFIHL